jgi:hypothetical protein
MWKVAAMANRLKPPAAWKPWLHLCRSKGDNWKKPKGSDETDCHLMVQCMEAWFLADHKTLQNFFGQGFNTKALPNTTAKIESITPKKIYQFLANATKSFKTKAKYGKGEHSFKLLAKIDPAKVTQTSPWAKRLINETKKKMER